MRWNLRETQLKAIHEEQHFILLLSHAVTYLVRCSIDECYEPQHCCQVRFLRDSFEGAR